VTATRETTPWHPLCVVKDGIVWRGDRNKGNNTLAPPLFC